MAPFLKCPIFLLVHCWVNGLLEDSKPPYNCSHNLLTKEPFFGKSVLLFMVAYSWNYKLTYPSSVVLVLFVCSLLLSCFVFSLGLLLGLLWHIMMIILVLVTDLNYQYLIMFSHMIFFWHLQSHHFPLFFTPIGLTPPSHSYFPCCSSWFWSPTPFPCELHKVPCFLS